MLSIRDIQGDGLWSPYADQPVVTQGVVTGVVRRGFFIQTPDKLWDGKGSDAVFVYSTDTLSMGHVDIGVEIEVSGTCLDYLKDEGAKPVTQIHLDSLRVIRSHNELSSSIKSVVLTADKLAVSHHQLAVYLNSLEGMLVVIPAGATFIAPSNHFGDYVVALAEQYEEADVISTKDQGVIIDASVPESDRTLRWFPGFRVASYRYAKRLNVGSRLNSEVCGPLNYRVGSYQIALSQHFDVEPNYVSLTKSRLSPSDGALTIMTLNCFNLDAHVESAGRVKNPRQDVDDDWGEGRFHTLAQAVVLQANSPDIVALQEIQDNDGAEMSEVTNASETYELLIDTIAKLGGARYKWVDAEPELGADGGQPGGNIRNAYLYNSQRVELQAGSVKTLGKRKACFEGSRKPLIAMFTEKHSGRSLAVINIHLASKRHQASIFAPQSPGVDAKLDVRTQQAKAIQQETDALTKLGIEYYVTGDFNDGEHSQPLKALIGTDSSNLVFSLEPDQRYDYNHRGKLQVLMHGVVPTRLLNEGRSQYEIIHGNELIGIEPGQETDKPSDHAYVIAKLMLSSS